MTRDLALPTFKGGSDILRILKSREDVYNLRRLRKFIIGNFDYETSYTKMIKSFSDINSTNKINNKLKIHYCAAPIRTTNRKIKAIIPLPGRNIFKVENNSFTKVSFLKSIWLLYNKKVSKTDFLLSNERKTAYLDINKSVLVLFDVKKP